MSDRQEVFRAMSGQLIGKQQMVVLAWKRGNWTTMHKTGAGWDFSLGSARLVVIQQAQASAEPVMILDSQLDERMRAHSYAPFRSALCIPIIKPWGIAALVFVEDPERAQSFSHRQLQSWQPLADQLSESITAEPNQIELPVLTPRVLGVVATVLLAAMALGWMLKPAPPPPKPRPKIVVAKPEEQRPEEVAAGFRAALGIGRYDMAYQFLQPELRKKLSQKGFEKRVRRWLQRPGVIQELGIRSIQVIVVRPARVSLSLESQAPGARAWRWEMVQTAEGWRLREVPASE
ncbi:MAG: hypothetical protein U0931_13205 [Vulcanimicrobiota bacterium]